MKNNLVLTGNTLPNDVRVHSYAAHEGISVPFTVDIALSTANAGFRITDCLAQRVTLEVVDAQDAVRHYDGFTDCVGFVAYRDGRYFFHLRLRPALAALEHREGSRIFQNKSPVDVIKEILADAGLERNTEWRLRQTYAPREFLCQYREREIDFVHRILEDEGIYYFYLHTADAHTLIFVDDPECFAAQDGVEPVTFALRQGGASGTQPLIELSRRKRLRPTHVFLRDYDFTKPDMPPEASLSAAGAWPITHYEYPAGFVADAEGARKARARLSELRSNADVWHGKSRAARLVCGTPVRVDGAFEPFLNGELIVTELRSIGKAENEGCENEFVAISKDAPFALPRRTRKPKIHGVQTAIVTGPSNEPEAIHVDEYGRIKVRFLWDRAGKQDDTSSCWLRASQLMLGGSMILPRVGWEVAVGFLDGDPDRPFVVGRVYNAENTPPYALPGAAADGALKSAATPGGTGHNEIKLGDSAGKQGLNISAKKNLNVSSGNDRNEKVGVDEEHQVGSNYNISIGSNEETTIGANQSVDVGNALQVKVGGSQSISVGGAEAMHAKCDFTEKVGGSRDYSVGGNQITISCGVRQDISGAFKRNVGAVQANLSLASIDDTMLGTFDETAGAVIVHLVGGTSVESVSGSKSLTSSAAELHIASAISTSAGSVKQLIGGAHVRNASGDIVVQAPTIMIGGGVGKFKGGGSEITLNGGPVTLKGSNISFDASAIGHLASNLKVGG